MHQRTDDKEINENILGIPKPSTMLHHNPFIPSMRSPKFHSFTEGRIESVSPDMERTISMDRNPFNAIHIGVIPGPISLRCDNSQFIKSWIKYIFQSVVTVALHIFSFIITILWIKFIFSSYYEYQYEHNQHRNDISSYAASILSYIPFSSWLWIAICFTHIVFVLGFMIQTWVIPIQWNFEDTSNTKLFRYFGVSFILIVILTNVTCTILQMLSYSIFYAVLSILQLMIVASFSFILLFVIIKNGQNATAYSYPQAIEHDSVDLSSDTSDFTNKQIYKNIAQKAMRKMNIIAAFSTHNSCFQLIIICTLFSCIITATITSFYVNFHFVLPLILSHNINRSKDVYFEKDFMIHLIILIFGTLFIGDLLILFMRVLMRWLTILLSGSYNNANRNNSISFSYNAHFGKMQSFNRMILFAIPLMFIIKLIVFVMLYTFINAVEFAAAITLFCIAQRVFNKIFIMIENCLLRKLIHDQQDIDHYDEQNVLQNLQDDHFLAQCDYIHDIIHYIATLLVPLMFALFGVNLQNTEAQLPIFHYIQTTAIQFAIQTTFDLLPFLVILVANPQCTTHTDHHHESFYQLSQNSPIKKQAHSSNKLTECALDLKVQYINMMNGWTATDKCVRHFMWWCTIFIGGYFAFYLLYPQQFLCAVKYGDDGSRIIFADWVYIQCQSN